MTRSLFTLLLSLCCFAFAGCGDDDTGTADTAVAEDTAVADTAVAEDTTPADTGSADTAPAMCDPDMEPCCCEGSIIDIGECVEGVWTCPGASMMYPVEECMVVDGDGICD